MFFSRITLEDIAGAEYEPYIFAALNSARVMILVTTSAEHANAVWVKNEWSRFLSLMRKDRKKLLLPCYRDMDPYDLPEALSVLQSYDMSKIGFIQDLTRGVNKVLEGMKPRMTANEKVVSQQSNTNVEPLLKRAYMFLEDGNWNSGNEYCEKVLDQDPENAQAYLGKLMAELRVRHQEDLPNLDQPFDNSNNYQKAVRFGGDKVAGILSGYIDHINERNENTRLTGIYNNGVTAMKAAGSESSYKAAAATFKTIPGFKDADSLAEQCLERAEVCRKDAVYDSAKSQMAGNDVSGYEAAIKTFSTISGWKDADEQIYACQRKIEEIKAKEEADRLERERQAEEKRIASEKAAKKRKKIVAIVTPIIVACIAFVIVLIKVIIPNQRYKNAVRKYSDLINAASFGDVIKFGHYEQDNISSNGKEEIEWGILQKSRNMIPLIRPQRLILLLVDVMLQQLSTDRMIAPRFGHFDVIVTTLLQKPGMDVRLFAYITPLVRLWLSGLVIQNGSKRCGRVNWIAWLQTSMRKV